MVINVTHQKGGVGKSTIITNLATSLNTQDNIILIDLDQQNSTKLWNDLRTRNNLKPFKCYCIEENKELDKIIKGNKDKIILVDSGGFDSIINRYALIISDMLITPVSASQLDVFGLDKFHQVIKEASKSIKKPFKSHIIINNISSQIKKDVQSLKNYCNSIKEFKVFDTILHTRIDFKRAYGNGQGVNEYNKKGTASSEITALAKEINELIN